MFYYFVEKYIVKILLKLLMIKYIILGTLAKTATPKMIHFLRTVQLKDLTLSRDTYPYIA